jgi:hypothetical protein
VRGLTESDFVITIGKCRAYIEWKNWTRSGKLKVSVMGLIRESDSSINLIADLQILQTDGDKKATVTRADWQIEAKLLA